MSKLSLHQWWLIVVLVVAFGARVYHIDHQSFWNDEGNSASLSSRSVQLIIEGTASDVHPPLFYLILRGWWPLAGQNDFSLRLISAVAGTLQVAAVIAIGRLWLSKSGAAAVGLLTALSPPLIYYSQEARMYALLGAIATLSMLVLLKGLKQGVERLKFKESSHHMLVASYFILTTLGLYTHYVYPAVIAAQGVIVCAYILQQPDQQDGILHRLWHSGRPWLFAVLASLFAYAPWIPIFLRTGSSTREAGSGTAAEFLQETGLWLTMGPFAQLSAGWLIGVIYGGMGVVFGLAALVNRKFALPVTVVFIWLFVPIILMFGVGATDASYHKFLTVSVPAVWLLAVLGTEWQEQLRPRMSKWRVPTLLLVTSIMLISFGFALQNQYHNRQTFRADYRAIAQQIQQDGRQNGAVILNAPNQWEVFTWYAGADGPQTLYPMPKTLRPDGEIEQEVADVLDQHDFVYALFWGFEGFDPNRIVERTLDAQAFKSSDQWYGDVRLATYGVLGDFLPNESNPPDLLVERPFLASDGAAPSGVQLDWVELSGTDFRPGDVIGLALQWRAIGEIDSRYKVFIHLINSDGQLIAQRDAEPVGNLKPTDGWGRGEVVLDQHGLLIPADLSAGSYQVVLGLYDVLPPNGRLVLNGDTADSILVAEIIVEP